jgi:cysteine desulfurase / selenocysteine lyase
MDASAKPGVASTLSTAAAAAALRERLPLLRDRLALNHAGISPQPLADRVARFEAARAERTPSEVLVAVASTRPRVRDLYARLLNVKAAEIAITKHTAEGVNFVAQGFPWKSGDNIVTASVEYPSNVYPWWNLRDRGVEIRSAVERDGRIDLAELTSLIDGRTRMVALSHVEFASGFAFSIPELVEICRPRDIFLFLDIAQSIGAIPVDLSGVDAAAWPNWKWLMGPLGMGGFYLAERRLELIRPVFVGGDGMVPTSDYLEYDFRFRPDASRFEYSTENMLGLLGVQESLEFFSPLLDPLRDDPDSVTARLFALGDELVALIEPLGFQAYHSRIAGERSGILTFRAPKDPKEALEKLKCARIEAAVRGGRLRLSPHFYNTSEDLAAVRAALAG